MLLELSLSNFRSHKETHITFTSGFNMIVGENGSGKSSIALAIGIVLFDLDHSNLKRYIKAGEDTATIEAVMSIDGLQIKVSRSFGRVSSWRVYDQDGIMADGRDACLTTLRQMFKVNDVPLPQFYGELIGVKQFEMTQPFLRDSNRKTFFDALLGVTEYQAAFANLLAGYKVGTQQLADLEKSLGILEYAKSEQDKNRSRLAELLDEKTALVAEIKEHGLKTLAITKLLDEMRLQQLAWQEWNNRGAELKDAKRLMQRVEKDLSVAALQRESARNEVNSLNALSAEKGELELAVVRYEVARALYDTRLSEHHARMGEFESTRLNLSTALAHLQQHNTCFVCGTVLDEETRQSLVDARYKELEALTVEPFELSPPVDPNSKLVFINTRLASLPIAERRFQEADASWVGLTKEFEALTGLVKSLTDAAGDEVSFDLEHYQRLQRDYQTSDNNRTRAMGRLEVMNERVSELADSLRRDFVNEITHHQVLIGGVKNTLETIDEVRRLYKTLGPLMARALSDRISRKADSILFSILGEHYPVSLKIVDDYDLEITIGKNTLSYSMLSGGQQVMVALAMRLALTKELSTVPFMVVDEPFDSLDPLSHEGVVRAINGIRGVQLIVIAHQDIFADIDNVIKLALTEEGETCIVN